MMQQIEPIESLADVVRPMNAPSHIIFRRATLSFAILLGVQCVWLLLPELLRTGIDRLPTDPASAAVAASQRGDAARAASIGIIRGDFWAESAFTYADLLWSDSGTNADLTGALQHVRASLDRALNDAPHQSGAWLLLAALASRYPSFNSNATEALKMSYYTGPSEQDLMPLRLRIAMNSGVFTDSEIREFIARDLRLFLAQKQKSAITAAYNAASPAGKQFIEQTIDDIDPSALDSVRARPPKQQ
jgi:hypothetical protein